MTDSRSVILSEAKNLIYNDCSLQYGYLRITYGFDFFKKSDLTTEETEDTEKTKKINPKNAIGRRWTQKL